MQDTIARVLSFAPLGFADDGKSMFFIQIDGGTGGGTLVGIYSPATGEAYAAFEKAVADLQKAADDENKAHDEATANGQPPPEITVTPAPSRPRPPLVVPQ
jgi:hypothetical protein